MGNQNPFFLAAAQAGYTYALLLTVAQLDPALRQTIANQLTGGPALVGSYTAVPDLGPDGDLDNDGVSNRFEGGSSGRSFINNCLTAPALIGTAGGTITHAGGLQIVVPSGVLSGDTTFEVTELGRFDPLFDQLFGSDEQVQPAGLTTFRVTNLDQLAGSTVTFTLPYQDENQDGYVDNGLLLPEADLSIVVFDFNTNNPTALESTVDTVANVVTASLEISATKTMQSIHFVPKLSVNNDVVLALAVVDADPPEENEMPLKAWPLLVVMGLLAVAAMRRSLQAA